MRARIGHVLGVVLVLAVVWAACEATAWAVVALTGGAS